MAPENTPNPGGSGLPGAFHVNTNVHVPFALDARLPLGTGRLEAADLGTFRLESGDRLPVTIAYRHDGPGPDAPQVVVVHALTGSADAAGDWWTPLIGPGKALDTDRVGVLCINLLGGRYGSTGPTSVDPATGLAWGSRFPQPTARDEARVIWALADRLDIESFALVTGGSMGGMIALEVALERPSRVGHVAAIASPSATGPMAVGWNHIQLELIDRLGWEGLALARQLAMTTYRSEADFETRFGRTVQDDGRFAISSYLDHQGVKLLERFDPDTYRVLVRVIDSHDLGRDRGGTVSALRSLAASGTGLTGVGVTGDILYGPVQVKALIADASEADVQVAYREVTTIKGHDAFLIEWDQLSAILVEALDDGTARSAHQREVLALPA
jgi:homoserine O-acetyltransferase/O-succinyltransferase